MSHTWELRNGKVMVRCGCQGPEGPERQDRRAGRDHSQTPDPMVRVLFGLALTIASTRRAGILGYHEAVRRLLNSHAPCNYQPLVCISNLSINRAIL